MNRPIDLTILTRTARQPEAPPEEPAGAALPAPGFRWQTRKMFPTVVIFVTFESY